MITSTLPGWGHCCQVRVGSIDWLGGRPARGIDLPIQSGAGRQRPLRGGHRRGDRATDARARSAFLQPGAGHAARRGRRRAGHGSGGRRNGFAAGFGFRGAAEAGGPPGAIVERIVLAIVNEAYRALGAGVATASDIDLAMRLGASHPLGPFERVEGLGGAAGVRERLRGYAGEGPRFDPAPGSDPPCEDRHGCDADGVPRAMRAIVILATTVLVASCGQPGSSASPVASPASPVAVSHDPGPIAGATDAFVVTLPELHGVYTGAVEVEAVSPTAARRTVATVTEVTAGLPDGTMIEGSEPILVSPSGFLTIAVEGPFDGTTAADAVTQRRLIFDLRAADRAPLVVPAGSVAWGPDGRLAIIGATGATFVDPMSGQTTSAVIPEPDKIEVAKVWAADGSGLLASRVRADDTSTRGVLTTDGRFLEGVRAPYSATGVGRPYGADGVGVGDATSEGPTISEAILLQDGPALDAPIPWLISRAPGPDPAIDDHTWDAAGVGQWVTLERDGTVRLAHLSKPTAFGPAKPIDHATLKLAAGAMIVGLAPDDSAVILSSGDFAAPTAVLLWVDPRTGATTRIERAGGISTFAGWAALP